MNEDLYKYLCENKFLLHGIGEITEIDTFKKFVSIFKTGGLLSKERLKEMGINVEGKVSNGGYRDASESVVSLFDPSLPQIKKRLLSHNYYLYLPFHPNGIFFIIEPSYLNLKRHETIGFEVDTTDGFIPLSSFVGIVSPLESIQPLQEFFEKNNINIPLYDFDFNCSNLNQNVQPDQKLK